jgi:oxygen-independent coproporphyrinogen III oxidase
MAGVYLHIPFCKQKCSYCDFHFSTTFEAYRDKMIKAICNEIHFRLSGAETKINTVYFGGGTPSLLQNMELQEIVNQLAKFVDVKNLLEFTLEANPDDITQQRLEFWRSIGINRLSIGIQSFEDDDLFWMNRAHSADESLKAIVMAQNAGFQNLTVDLMYGLPNQSLDRWKKQLHTVLNLNIPHISSYCLTVEERTALKKHVEKGDLLIPDEELVAGQFDLLVSTLEQHGYEHYEISNFAKPNAHAIHNSNYWKGEHYFGIGPSAHGFNGIERYWNISNNTAYIKTLEAGGVPQTIELLEPKDRFNELILTGLRTHWGVDYSALSSILDLDNAFEKRLATMEENDIVEWIGQYFRLTKKAKLQADYWASELFI